MATLINGETYTLKTPELEPVKLEEKFDEEPMASLDPDEGIKILDENEVTPMNAADVKGGKGKKTFHKKAEEEGDAKGDSKKKTTKKKQQQSKKHTNANANPNATSHVAQKAIDSLGDIEALPKEIDGKTINYLPRGFGCENLPKTLKMMDLPLNSVTVFDHWRKVDGIYGDTYVMYVKDHADLSYWSNSRATAILAGGFIDPTKHYFTISRLEKGGYIYGTIDRV